ncbi:MAG: ABC transporter ATP-binding protein/permease [Lachnospiraceae bacterium]|nr:ABC transporter ATP-binding protein/permease [Butyrivibrio sp.]MCM1344999.1 ABC transporter ATP-binding protein/permease [Muribaculaceae bacterium]MCM1412151.1 ABC transporter ATP-binding protein/permease [Lachnospiraceae bacterium]
MIQESELLKKLTFRQNMTKIHAVLKLIQSMDRSYLPWQVMDCLLQTVIEYGALILSGYVVNSLTAGGDLWELVRTAVWVCVLLGILRAASSALKASISVKRSLIARRYDAMQDAKLTELDFSMLDSPRLKEIQEQIQRDSNWGAGIYTIFWQGERLIGYLLRLVGAVAAGASVFRYLGGGNAFPSACILTGMAFLTFLGMRVYRRYQKITQYMMFHIPTLEEKKVLYDFAWGFGMLSHYRYQNGKDVRIYDAYGIMKHWTYDKATSRAYQDYFCNRPVVGAAGTGAAGGAMRGLSTAGAYFLIAWLALTDGVPVGTVILFAGCLANLFEAVVALAVRFQELALAARKQVSILELLSLSDEMYKGSLPMEKRSDGQYTIEFRNVSFRYPGSEDYALRNFSLKLNVGEKLAIVGRNGSGKTTMIKLLCRLYDPDEGEILVNGVNIRKFRQEEYVKLFSVVFQDFQLFSLALAENVAASAEYEEKRVERCLEDVGFGERLAKLKKENEGIRTYLYQDYVDSGVEISGGEAQKIAIARAIYRESPFVLLDEPTAALDPLAEAEIYANFDKIAGEKTAVYISHRLSSCRFCKKIAVFDKGRLVQLGSHEELLAEEDGTYARLWNAQAQYYQGV